jgi:hypothetical protein
MTKLSWRFPVHHLPDVRGESAQSAGCKTMHCRTDTYDGCEPDALHVRFSSPSSSALCPFDSASTSRRRGGACNGWPRCFCGSQPWRGLSRSCVTAVLVRIAAVRNMVLVSDPNCPALLFGMNHGCTLCLHPNWLAVRLPWLLHASRGDKCSQLTGDITISA